jgi:hydrogenase maturation protein HypF
MRIEGTVQGVGFRPHVYRLASDLGLGGYVLNDERGVLLEAEGDHESVEQFLFRLRAEAPPLAEIQRVLSEDVEPCGEDGFRILASGRAGEPLALVTPDAATCADCVAELFDPADRRHRYPFVNCTNCGPRFTIVCGVPYDRPLTTMAGFAMCARCQAEYDDPGDRRFHAQPNACPDCGPTVRLGDAVGEDALATAAAALRDGQIVAVKGVGGYHLACRADDERAVATLRARKHREEKPFALMAPDLEAARALVELGPADEALLLGRERPIVLAPRCPGARVAAAVAPGASDLGVMLPYSPLHHLLLADAGAVLVMTSGNVSDEPIAHDDEDARERLGPIADRFLTHDRPIHMRTDDSVVRARRRGAALLMRRSRGYVPASLDLPLPSAPLVACGAELKATFCLAKQRRAWVGHHVGDLQNLETLTSFRDGVAHFEQLFAVTPEVVAHDLHPDYLSTRYALERDGVELVGVQHHHAHLAACLAEHGETGPAVGAIFDGTGLGTDGTIWGGELLVGDLVAFERAGHLREVRLPGGDQAVREPWRMACAWLGEALGAEPRLPASLAGAVEPWRWEAVTRMARAGFAAPVTTSMGRLFDAVAALAGVCHIVSYEGQAAAELEGAVASAPLDAAFPYPLPIDDGPPVVLDARPTILAVAHDVAAGASRASIAMRFHAAVADATARACAVVAERHGLTTVVLSGGVFQNRLLVDASAGALERNGLRVLVPERLPPNDGAISYGQAAVAAARIGA